MPITLLRPGLATVAVIALAAGSTASNAAALTPASAKAIVQPLYDALNEPEHKDVDGLLEAVTTDDFRSCSNEAECGDRNYLAARFKGFGEIMPDLRWSIEDVWVSGDKVFVRGEATGTPIKPLFGTPPTGRSFKTMSLDMFIIRGAKISFSYHVENWLSALNQISGK
jgi:predicted ester cyclase